LDAFLWQALLEQADEEIVGKGHTSADGEGRVDEEIGDEGHTSAIVEGIIDEDRNATTVGGGGTTPADGGVTTSFANLEHAPNVEGGTPRPVLDDEVVKV
jgi:hypothetical protein